MLDTNAVIGLMKGNLKLTDALRRHPESDFAISSVVAYELFFGAYKSEQLDKNLAQIGRLQFPVLDFSVDDARAAGEIRAILKKSGTPIGVYDIMIAGQALARDLTLITRNIREFERIRGLKIENWED